MPQNENNDVVVFAETTFRHQRRKFGIKHDDRRRHMYFVGKTGMGKSTILENMIVGDIKAGRGVAVVDPHGDLAEKIMGYIPSNRVNDVIYFNPADMDYPIAFNVVEHVDPKERHLVASGLVGVFQKLWADTWGPRLEYILRNAILAVLDYPDSTLLAVTRMLSDRPFRKKVVEKIQDPVVKSFWINEFSGYADKFASEAVAPIQNKVGQFLSTSLIRNIVGQVKSTINIRSIIDEGKILVMNLSKGRIGEDSSALLGAMMITKIQLAAMSRVDRPEAERRDFYLYVDEFQNFATDSFANILSEARKYRLNLIMAHQYIEQLGEKVKPAVFGNVGTMVVFRVGADDAEELVREFAPVFTEEDLVNLPKYEFYLKLMIDGISSDPFSARGLPPLSLEERTGNEEKVIKVSRERYAKPRVSVEEKISRWHGIEEENTAGGEKRPEKGRNAKAERNFSPAGRDFPREKRPREEIKPFRVSSNSEFIRNNQEEKEDRLKEVYKYEAICAKCGRKTSTSFQPDGIRPVFCRDCLNKIKEEKKRDDEDRRRSKEEELKKLNKTEELTLGEALKKKPVVFGPGKEKRENQPPEKNLEEGEEVKF